MLHLFEVIQNTRDLSLLAAAAYALVNLKPLTSAAKSFFARSIAFMDRTENTMAVIQSNHLEHIQASLEALVKKSEEK